MTLGRMRIWRRSIFAIGFATLAFLYAFPQKDEPPPTPKNFHRWGSITLFNGLPSDTVRVITQTDDGILWFGTDTGLARFDGRRIQSITFKEGQPVRINALAPLANNDLLVGTDSGAYFLTQQGVSQVPGTEGLTITALSSGKLPLLGAGDGRVFQLQADPSGQKKADVLPIAPLRTRDGKASPITTIIETDRGILLGTDGGGLQIAGENSFARLPNAPRPVSVNAIADAGDGSKWVAGDAGSGGDGLYHLTGTDDLRQFGPPAGDVLSIAPDGSDGVWVGTRRYGLFHFRNETDVENFAFENTAGGLRSNTVYSLFVDRDGVVWAGTDRGISRFDPGSPFFQTLAEEPNGNFVRTLAQLPSGRLIAGTNRGMFERVGREWKEIDTFKGLPIYSVLEEADGNLLVATPQGLVDSTRRTLLSGDIRSVFRFRDGLYAVVYGKGLIAVDGTTDPPPIFPNPGITTAAVIGGRAYLGTASDGVFEFDGTAAKILADDRTLANGAVWRIIPDGGDGLLIAGERGLTRLANGVAERLIENHPVRDVVVNGDDIWAATADAGILHRRIDPEFGSLSSSIGPEQGLPSEKVFALLSTGDELLVGTNRGIAAYKPGRVAPKIFPVRVSSRRLHDLSELSAPIALDFPQDSLLLEVAGQSSRTFPEEFQYAFTLSDQNGKVIERRLSADPQFAATGLKPGAYRIEARVFNRALLSSEPFRVEFSIGKAPFPWTATALAILLLLALIGLAWAIIERRRIAVRNRELAAARLDLANEAEKERSRIARDLHDQTLADLRGLMMKSDRMLPAESGFRSDIESISTEIRRICEDLSPSVLENVGLIAALEFLISHSVATFEFDAGAVSEDMIDLPLNVQLQIYRIAQEVLSNISRHSDASLVKMSIETAGTDFKLAIDDDGKPFSPVERSPQAGRGIGGIRSRASIIGAKVEWLPQDTGNRFELYLSRAMQAPDGDGNEATPQQ